MLSIVSKISPAIKWVLNGFDRIVFKGAFQAFWHEANVPVWLERRGVLNKEFKVWMKAQSQQIVERAEALALSRTGHPVLRFQARDRKEEVARRHQRERGIGAGLLGVYWALENCQTFRATFDPHRPRPAIRQIPTKCKHLYFYADDPVFGLMSVRLQTWFPYAIQIQLNGRQWLRRSLEKESVEHLRRGNKFLFIEDWERAHHPQMFDPALSSWRPGHSGGRRPRSLGLRRPHDQTNAGRPESGRPFSIPASGSGAVIEFRRAGPAGGTPCPDSSICSFC